MSVEIVPAQLEHIALIAANLREEFPADVDWLQALKDHIEASTEAFSGFIDSDIACIWGTRTQTILNDSVYFWLLTTKLVEERPFVFVRHSQIIARQLLKSYSKIIGWVAEDNAPSVKWLRWLGCELGPLSPGLLSFELRRA